MGGPVQRAVYYCSVSARPDPARGTAARHWLAALLCAVVALPALAAEPLGDLYTVTVPYTGQNEATFREAMRDILVRVTGRRDAPELENLAPLVAQASRYVVSFRRGAGNTLAVTFDGQAIENAMLFQKAVARAKLTLGEPRLVMIPFDLRDGDVTAPEASLRIPGMLLRRGPELLQMRATVVAAAAKAY